VLVQGRSQCADPLEPLGLGRVEGVDLGHERICIGDLVLVLLLPASKDGVPGTRVVSNRVIDEPLFDLFMEFELGPKIRPDPSTTIGGAVLMSSKAAWASRCCCLRMSRASISILLVKRSTATLPGPRGHCNADRTRCPDRGATEGSTSHLAA
jgi:hypothetical protein